jgi:hypothetical protein
MSSSSENRGVQPVSRLNFSLLATRRGGSPSLRSAMRNGTVRPLTRSTLRITSSTEWPLPLPRL